MTLNSHNARKYAQIYSGNNVILALVVLSQYTNVIHNRRHITTKNRYQEVIR